jgi:hypothetical protein
MRGSPTRAARRASAPKWSRLSMLGVAALVAGGLLAGSLAPVHAQTQPPPPPPSASQPPPPVPAPQTEVAPPSPASEYVWVPGEWAWRPWLGRYVWIPGYYHVPVRPTHVWVPSYWAWGPAEGYHWVEGYWRDP